MDTQHHPSLPKQLGYILVILFCIAYLANPTGGIIELIPDNLPLLGNIDEAGIASLLVLSIQYLIAESRRHRPHVIDVSADVDTQQQHNTTS